MTALLHMIYAGVLQLLRARIAAFFLAGGLMVVGFSLLLEELAAGQSGRAVVHIGLAGIALVTSILAGVLPVILVRGELDNRHAHVILTRPIPRSLFVISRFAVTSIAVVVATLVFSLILAGLSVVYQAESFGTVVTAALFGSLGPILLAAVSMVASVATTSVTSLVTVSLIFLLGRLTPELAELGQRGGPRGHVLDLLARVLPDLGRFQWFNVAGTDSAAAAVVYCFCYVAFLITVASTLIGEKDLD